MKESVPPMPSTEWQLARRCQALSAELQLPSADLESRPGRLKFLADLMEQLPRSLPQWQHSLEAVVDVVVSVVQENRLTENSGWPEGQPGRLFDALIEQAIVDSASQPEPSETNGAVELLHAFLAKLGRFADHERRFFSDQRILVDKILAKLDEDLPWLAGVLRKGRGRAVRLAELLALDYSLTRGTQLRRKSISKLEELVRKVPEHYADPLIQDLLVVYRKMNLGNIESKYGVD